MYCMYNIRPKVSITEYQSAESCFVPSIHFLFRWLAEIGCNCSNSNSSFYVIQLDACVTYAQIAQLCRPFAHWNLYLTVPSKFTRMHIESNCRYLYLSFFSFYSFSCYKYFSLMVIFITFSITYCACKNI